MIVDIQGVENVLTDPQINCLDKHRFGKGPPPVPVLLPWHALQDHEFTGMLKLNMQAVDVHVQDVDSLIFEESVGDTLSGNPILF
jgi:hypothetical protein